MIDQAVDRWARVVLALVGVGLVAATSAGCTGGNDADEGRSETPTTTAVTPKPVPFTEARASRMRHVLTAGRVAQLPSVVEMPAGKVATQRAADGLKALGDVTIDRSTFHDNQDATATVTARVAASDGRPAQTWTVYLVVDHGRWMISATVPA